MWTARTSNVFPPALHASIFLNCHRTPMQWAWVKRCCTRFDRRQDSTWVEGKSCVDSARQLVFNFFIVSTFSHLNSANKIAWTRHGGKVIHFIQTNVGDNLLRPPQLLTSRIFQHLNHHTGCSTASITNSSTSHTRFLVLEYGNERGNYSCARTFHISK